ncbi:type VII secretion system-associated protein [Actinoallomurus soli]|uniref:type VII secretion system-associated protein n=1 Tax=Actinoallomurus soli TaxID=2952535 RepID=UPI0020928B36|nr:type VII secretion system-associated protein [Actinoallomurus soli]MCO5971945.1 type VII secretion system-associated protein [Actinoallomurus soli]
MTTEQGGVPEQPAAAIPGTETIQGAGERMPPVPDSIREAARLAPDHWLGMVDPAWNEEGEPPSWAVVGQWRSSPEGEIVEWRENEEYRPSPEALGWPEPADDVDAAVQLAATGYGPGDAVTEALAAAKEVAVFVTRGGDPLAAVAPDGKTPVIPVFTSPVYLHAAGRLAFELMDLWELLDALPEDHVLYLNPSAPVSMTVETAVLVEALERAGADAGEAGAQADDVEPPARPATVGGGPAPERG